MFGEIKNFFKKVTPEEEKKIEDGKKLEETAAEMMKGDTASPEASKEETVEEKNEVEKE